MGRMPLPLTQLQVAQAFGLNEHEDSWSAKIAGYPHPVHMSPPGSLFSNVNLLGADFCSMNGFSWDYDNDLMVTYYIGKNWEVHPKPKL
jgi:hypothetical protein